MRKSISGLIVFVFLCVACPGGAGAITLPDPTQNAMLYGDFYSYSLPILAYMYDEEFGGGVGPGNPFYVKSTPGHISSSIVIATGASGVGVNTNYAGMDNAYPTPNSSGIPTFSTGTTADPGFTGPMPTNNPDTWDTTIAALLGYLEGDYPVFMFNNNQEKSEQNLWAYGQIRLWDSGGAAAPVLYDLVSPNGDGTGIFGGDPYTYVSPSYANPAWQPGPMDYVFSGGAVCLGASGSPVACGSPEAVAGPFDHNLGADQVAYAIFSPELNAFLQDWSETSSYDMISVDLRMHSLNSGYEQAFILPGQSGEYPVPEPASAVMMLLGMACAFTLVKLRFT